MLKHYLVENIFKKMVAEMRWCLLMAGMLWASQAAAFTISGTVYGGSALLPNAVVTATLVATIFLQIKIQ